MHWNQIAESLFVSRCKLYIAVLANRQLQWKFSLPNFQGGRDLELEHFLQNRLQEKRKKSELGNHPLFFFFKSMMLVFGYIYLGNLDPIFFAHSIWMFPKIVLFPPNHPF